MKGIGALLILLASGWLGGSWTRLQRKKLRLLDALGAMLSRLCAELGRGTPLPVFFAGEAQRERCLSERYRRAARGLAQGGGETALGRELTPLEPLCPDSAGALRALLPLLGRYDSETQRAACGQAAAVLAREREEIAGELARRGRLCRTVTICAGALLVLALW